MKKIINTIVFLMIVFSCSYTQIINEFAGKVKIGQVDTVNTENSIVVRLPDGTLGERLAQTLTIHQLISISNDTIFLQNGGYIKLPATFDGAFNNLTGIPSGLADGDDDTQLTEAQVDAFTNNNGYLINELDGNPRNEIQVLSISNDTIFLEYGGFVKLPKSFNGSFNNLTGIPAGLADGDDDTQLTEAQVDAFANNNGYLLNEVDGSITNEIQDLSLSGNILTITNNGTATDIDLSAFLDNTDTQLTESQVDAFVGNNGYLSREIDGSITNEIQDLSLSGNILTITNNGTATDIDLSAFLDNTDTQLTESQVDAFVGNNGYLSAEIDGSITNEIQDLSLSGNILTITDNGTATDIDLSAFLDNTDTQLTESQVDAFVGNNGYLSTEVDGSITNEIQDLSLSGNILTITNNGTATDIDLSAFLDNTDTQLTESQVDAFVGNNGYLSAEIDGSITNEIQDLNLSGNILTITNNGTATDIDLSAFLDNTDTQLTESQVDAFVGNNGYLSAEIDGSITNEIQDLSLSGNTLTITNNGTATDIDLSAFLDNTDTQLTESQVDAFVGNNGYLSTELDGSITNEIQDLSLSGNILTITNNGTATDIDLSAFLDNTDTQLTESQVDAFVGNNGYLSAEIDGSITNEIQALSISNDTIFLENGGYAKLPLLNDDDPTNEIQNFGVSQIGDTLYLSGGNSFIVPGISEANPQDGDGNFYPVITIGSQKWLGEDLRTTKYNDGTPIPNLPDTYSWVRDTTGAYSWYNNDPSQSPYPRGAFYNWFATDENSNGNKNVCPVGWHVPSMTEFQDLANFLGGSSVAGGKLKEIGTQFWRPPNTGATDDFGFGAIPHGRRDGFNGSFSFSIFLNTTSFYWTTYEENSRIAQTILLTHDNTTLEFYQNLKKDGYQVRCIKD